MSVSIFRCKSCGSVIVVNIKDVWKLSRCTKCNSGDIANMEDFELDSESTSNESEPDTTSGVCIC